MYALQAGLWVQLIGTTRRGLCSLVGVDVTTIEVPRRTAPSVFVLLVVTHASNARLPCAHRWHCG